ncbi:MAG: polysaccharide biosynthesis protein [bacterium]|nr:polysaccharide biosynthesis protein [bacterium]
MKKILIIGAGEAGQMVAREIENAPELGMSLDCWIDDDESLQGREILGRPVLGATTRLAAVARERSIDEAIIAIPSAGGSTVRRLIRVCLEASLHFKIVPGLREIVKGDVRFEQIREVNPQDLLGRESVDFQTDTVRRQIAGQVVMITGAGGSIGSQIARLIAPLGPARLILMGRGENSIFEIENELRELHPGLDVLALIADMRDRERLLRLGRDLRPDIIYHAAAHKHVHFMEAWPTEAFTNTILGTRNLIEFCREAGTAKMVMLSTDKAVDPHGVMGASKRVTELLLLSAHIEGKAREAAGGERGTRFISVRFGNVLGSRGSVVPLFMRQIRNGGPVTVTDADATRFFMTIKEASQLVIEAGCSGEGGEVFILNMGESMEILELARSLIRLSGLEPERDIPIKFTGLRPGEKMHEKLMTRAEAEVSEFGEQLMIIRPRLSRDFDIAGLLTEFEVLTTAGRDDELRQRLLNLARDMKDLL